MSNKWPLSASQLDTFLTCQRKWGYRYIDNIKPPPSNAAAFGSSVHEVIANFMSVRTEINIETPEGRVLNPGLIFLPADVPKENIERYFEFTHQGHSFRGYIDFFKQLDKTTWLIGDHKTCSSFKTALPAHELKKNIQANTYAQWAFQEFGAKKVKLRWIYYRTKSKPEARYIETEIKSEEQTSLFWPQLVIAKDIMRIVKSKRRSYELPKNTKACFKYGPCPFYARCKYGAEMTEANQNHSHPRSSLALKPDRSQCIDGANSFHLFLDCAPVKSSPPYEKTIELSELIRPVLKKIQQEKNIAHYRLVGYGQHVGVMAHYLEDYLKENTFDNRTAVLSSSKTPEGIDTLQTLSAAASQVVRGF